jgi:hypothetical protein
MVSFYPSTSFRSGSSLSNLSNLSDLSDFKALQDTAKKKFGLQSVIFRDNLETAHDVMSVLEDLQQSGYNFSDISVMVSDKASRKKTRKEFGFKEGDTPTIINENFQSCKHLFTAKQQLETNPANQEKLIEGLRFGGFATYTTVGKIQKPLVTVEPKYQNIKTDAYSTKRKDHLIYHELIHALHIKKFLSTPPVQKEIRGSQRQRQPVGLPATPYHYLPEAFNRITELITKEVGQYAGTHFIEFVPEYWIFKRFNPSYVNQKLDELYRCLKGPEILPKPQKPSTP